MKVLILLTLAAITMITREIQMEQLPILDQFINDLKSADVDQHLILGKYFTKDNLEFDKQELQDRLRRESLKIIKENIEKDEVLIIKYTEADQDAFYYMDVHGDQDNVYVLVASSQQFRCYMLIRDGKIASVNPIKSGRRIIGWY